LAVDRTRAGLGVSVGGATGASAQKCVYPFEKSSGLPKPPEGVDGRPRREVPGQGPPLAAGAQEVEQGVEEQSQGPSARSATPRGKGQQRLQDVPLAVGQAGRIVAACHPLSLESDLQTPSKTRKRCMC
jgi:hypothetical protein